jgi:hypothetical protein
MRTKRVIGLIVVGCLLASVAVLGLLIAWIGSALGILVGLLIAVAVIGTYLRVLGPSQRRWGATEEEVRRAMPGDDLLRRDAPSTTRAITINGSPEEIFPWLLQIGYGRGGWYSYDWIDNDGKPSAARIDPALQRLAVGERIEMLPGHGTGGPRDRAGPLHRRRRRDGLLVPAGRAHARRSDATDQLLATGLAEDGEHVRRAVS